LLLFEEVQRVDLLDHPVFTRPVITEPDEAAARRSLREQISRLERDLAAAVCSAYPRVTVAPAGVRRAGPRMLGLGELESLRDELAESLRHVRGDLAAQAERQEAKRVLIERMLLEPARYKWVRVTNEDIGQPGCKNWHVRPRLGIIGMLSGWWHVKISSGCPLARGPRRSPWPRTSTRWASEAARGAPLP
jgi:hypothetical protein